MATNWAHFAGLAPALAPAGSAHRRSAGRSAPIRSGAMSKSRVGTRRPRATARPGRPARRGAGRASRGSSPSPLAAGRERAAAGFEAHLDLFDDVDPHAVGRVRFETDAVLVGVSVGDGRPRSWCTVAGVEA